MLVLLFCKLSEQYSQTNFTIIKPFKVTKKERQIFRPKIKKVIILSFLLKNKNKYTHNIQVKQTNSVLFPGTRDAFSRAFKKLNERI